MARVWSAFLTEQDRAYDDCTPAFSDRHHPGRRPVLLLVDLYRKAFGERPEPLLEAARGGRANLGLAAWQALPHLGALLAAARAASVPVVHVTRLVNLSEWSELGRADRVPTPEQRAARERDYSIIDELAPLPGEIVLGKRSSSVFASTPIIAVLNELGADTIIVAGESTSGCVRAAVLDAHDLRYSVLVAEECVFDRTEASHAIALYDMYRKNAKVLPLAEVIAYLAEAGA